MARVTLVLGVGGSGASLGADGGLARVARSAKILIHIRLVSVVVPLLPFQLSHVSSLRKGFCAPPRD